MGTHDGSVQEMARIRLRCLVFAPLHVFGKLRNCDARQDPDDCDNDHQFDQGEASLQHRHGMKDFRVNETGNASSRSKQISRQAQNHLKTTRARLPCKVIQVTIFVTSRALGCLVRI